MRKSDICFYFSITKEENSDFDDNLAAMQPPLGPGEHAVSSLAPAGSGGGTNNDKNGGEDKITINCTASTPLLGDKTDGFNLSVTNLGGLSPGGCGGGGSSGSSRGDGGLGGSSLNLSPSPTSGFKEGPCGSPGIAMQYLNQMAKPMESNLLLPPNLSMRRGTYVNNQRNIRFRLPPISQ